MTDNVETLLEQLRQAKEEVDQLKTELSKLNKTKESWYQKKIALSKNIGQHIQTLTQNKTTRNSLTGQVKELKDTRNKFNTQINQEVAAIKTLKAEHQKLLTHKAHTLSSEDHRTTRGANLHQQIKALEYKLETEPTSFEKEQKLVKKIKDLKKKTEALKDVSEISRKIREKSAAIDHLKKEANEIHRKMHHMAGQSQEHHEYLVGSSKEIDEIRAQEKEAHEQFMKHKADYQQKNDELKQKLQELKKIREELNKHHVKLQEETFEEERKTLKEKEAEVNDKIKNRKKLTTEDLLVLQKAEEKSGRKKE